MDVARDRGQIYGTSEGSIRSLEPDCQKILTIMLKSLGFFFFFKIIGTFYTL